MGFKYAGVLFLFIYVHPIWSMCNMIKDMQYKWGILSVPRRVFGTSEVHHQYEWDMGCRQGTSSSFGKGRHLFCTIHWPGISFFQWTVLAYNICIQYKWKCYVLFQLRVHQGAKFPCTYMDIHHFWHKHWYWSWVTLVSHWQEALGMLQLKTVAWVFLLVSNQESIGFCVL